MLLRCSAVCSYLFYQVVTGSAMVGGLSPVYRVSLIKGRKILGNAV